MLQTPLGWLVQVHIKVRHRDDRLRMLLQILAQGVVDISLDEFKFLQTATRRLLLMRKQYIFKIVFVIRANSIKYKLRLA